MFEQHTLSILSLKTLEAMKADARDVNADPASTYAARIEAREMRDAVNAELDRRILFVAEVLGATDETPEHTLREGSEMFHTMDCPGCQGTSFTASPRSETYWSS